MIQYTEEDLQREMLVLINHIRNNDWSAQRLSDGMSGLMMVYLNTNFESDLSMEGYARRIEFLSNDIQHKVIMESFKGK
jgi:hypothetical protein